jgi:hypothetical protein
MLTRFPASNAVLLKPSLFWVFKQLLFVTIVYQQFGTTFWAHFLKIEDGIDSLSQNVIKQPLPIYAA